MSAGHAFPDRLMAVYGPAGCVLEARLEDMFCLRVGLLSAPTAGGARQVWPGKLA